MITARSEGLSGIALVLGAGGFIGSHLTSRVRSQGQIVLTEDLLDATDDELSRFETRLSRLLELHDPGVIFHLIGSGTPRETLDKPDYHFRKNVAPAIAIARVLTKIGYRGRLLFVSSGAVYGNTSLPAREGDALSPVTALGRAKLEAEHVLRAAPLNLVVARPFQIFGEGQKKLVVFELAQRIAREHGPLKLNGTGRQLRDFVYIEEAVGALCFLASAATPLSTHSIYNIASGRSTSIATLGKLLLAVAGQPNREVVSIPCSDANPLECSIGDPTRLQELGFDVGGASKVQLQRTLQWAASCHD